MFCINSYVHHDGSAAVLAAFKCGTDFTFKSKEFKEFMDNVCMALMVNGFGQFENDIVPIPANHVECVHQDNLTIEQYAQQMTKHFQEEIWVDPVWTSYDVMLVEEDYREIKRLKELKELKTDLNQK